MKQQLWLVVAGVLFAACGSLSPSGPAPLEELEPAEGVRPQVVDNVPGTARERLLRVLPAANDRFLVLGVTQNSGAAAQNVAFVRRYLVSAEGVGLDTAFGQNGQFSFGLEGEAERAHDAVVFQDGLNLRFFLVGSTVLLNDRVPALFGANLSTGAVSARFFNEFAGEEAKVIGLDGQNPPRLLIGLEGNANNRFRLIRMQGAVNLDPTFSQDGSFLVQVPAPNALGFSSLRLEGLAVAPNGNVMLAGNGFQPNPLGGQTVRPFTARVTPGLLAQSISVINIPLDRVRAIATDTNNRVLLAGDRSNAAGIPQLALARLGNNLALDTTFNGGLGFNSTSFQSVFQPGVGAVTLPSQGLEIGLDGLGRIVVGGSTDMPAGALLTTRAMALARFTAGGALDASFGQAGRIVRSEGNGLSVGASSLAFFNQGRVVAGGTVSNSFNTDTTLSIQRIVAP